MIRDDVVVVVVVRVEAHCSLTEICAVPDLEFNMVTVPSGIKESFKSESNIVARKK